MSAQAFSSDLCDPNTIVLNESGSLSQAQLASIRRWLWRDHAPRYLRIGIVLALLVVILLNIRLAAAMFQASDPLAWRVHLGGVALAIPFFGTFAAVIVGAWLLVAVGDARHIAYSRHALLHGRVRQMDGVIIQHGPQRVAMFAGPQGQTRAWTLNTRSPVPPGSYRFNYLPFIYTGHSHSDGGLSGWLLSARSLEAAPVVAPMMPGVEAAGFPGFNSSMGMAGSAGMPGALGTSGTMGMAGILGMPGAVPHPGIPGMPGMAGAAGMPGAPGVAGMAGMQGNVATPGMLGVPDTAAGRVQALLPVLAAANGFLLDALPENRAGRLTPQQAQLVARDERRSGLTVLLIGLIVLAAGILALRGDTHTGPDWGVVALAGAGLVLIVFAVVRGITAYSRDLATRRVATLEGRVHRFTRTTNSDGGRSVVTYYYKIQGQVFELPGEPAYDALDESLWYRAYYLPRSKHLVNIEPMTPTEASAPRPQVAPWEAASDAIAGIPAAPAPPGANALVTAQEVSAALGVSVYPPSERSFFGTTFATYSDTSGTVRAALTCVTGSRGAAMFESMKRRAAGTPYLQPISGLGDEAFWLGGQALGVRKGATTLMVTLPDPSTGGQGGTGLGSLAAMKLDRTPNLTPEAQAAALAAASQIARAAISRL